MPVAKTKHVIGHVTRWHDNVDVDNAYAFALRVFTVTDQHHHLHYFTIHIIIFTIIITIIIGSPRTSFSRARCSSMDLCGLS